MRRPPDGLPLLLLLVTVTVLGTNAVSLRRRDSLDPLDTLWELTDRYQVPGKELYCQKCPAGTYVAEECKEQNSLGRCLPCGPGDYMEYPNAFQWCRECGKCREDQVELSPCRATRNTVCACRNGTFCPPDHPCEMCQKCQPRCPEGQVVLRACTPYSDLQCGPAADSDSVYSLTVILAVITFVVLMIFGFCMWKRCSSSPGDGRPSSRRPYEMVRSMFRKLPWYRSENAGREDNATNEQRAMVTETEVMLKNERPKRSLVPVKEDDPIHLLRRSFYIFAGKVPKVEWKKFGRSLDLEENDIIQEWTDDAFYQMLFKWQSREGSKASVNTLLDTLDRLHLSGVADDISSNLSRMGLFQSAETS